MDIDQIKKKYPETAYRTYLDMGDEKFRMARLDILDPTVHIAKMQGGKFTSIILRVGTVMTKETFATMIAAMKEAGGVLADAVKLAKVVKAVMEHAPGEKVIEI